MKRIAALAAFAAVIASAPAHATDVGVSIRVGEPGFYGQIDIGSMPRPVLVYPRPVVIRPAPVAVIADPVYMRVPPGHARNWRKHCAKYGACERPVYFVQDHWYNTVYVPQYRHAHGDHDRHRGRDERHGRGRRDD